MTHQYGAILADPPWMERGGGKIKRGADRHYPLMHTKDICALPVASLALPDSHLYLWVTNNFLPDGLKVMAAWDFRYVTCVTWAKDKQGVAYVQFAKNRNGPTGLAKMAYVKDRVMFGELAKDPLGRPVK